MFGDMGHGGLLFLAGAFLCIFADKLRSLGGMDDVLSGRYLFVLMGFFGMYNGFIYNEFFALPIEFFSSCYRDTLDNSSGSTYYLFVTPDQDTRDCVYPFGMDYRWA